MPDLPTLHAAFTDGRTHTLRALVQRFLCEPPDVLQHLTRRNGFVERREGKKLVWDFNPLVAELEKTETV